MRKTLSKEEQYIKEYLEQLSMEEMIMGESKNWKVRHALSLSRKEDHTFVDFQTNNGHMLTFELNEEKKLHMITLRDKKKTDITITDEAQYEFFQLLWKKVEKHFNLRLRHLLGTTR